MRDTFIHRLSEMAERDPQLLLLTGDLGFGVFDEFRRRFPRQFLNVGVAEQNMAGVAAGLALEGHVVYIYSIANFVFMRCLEQIRNDAAYHEANVNVVAIGGGFSYGALGMSHHATEDLAIMRALPGVTVSAPCDCWEAAEATEAIASVPGVSYLRLDKSHASVEPGPNERFEFGKARVLRQGFDVTLIACGGIMEEVLAAAEALAGQGVDCRVISVHTLKPLDGAALAQAAIETGGIVTVEEHVVDGGLGGAVAEALLDRGAFPRRFHRLGLENRFTSIVGSQVYLRQHYHLDRDAIVRCARDVSQAKRRAA